MTFTNTGRSGLALLMAGTSTIFPRYAAIGSGSGAVAASNTALIGESGIRQDFTGRDVSTLQKVTWTHDFNSSQMSGLQFTEFALFDTSVAVSGTMWNREAFSAVTFDGTTELQLQVTYEIF